MKLLVLYKTISCLCSLRGGQHIVLQQKGQMKEQADTFMRFCFQLRESGLETHSALVSTKLSFTLPVHLPHLSLSDLGSGTSWSLCSGAQLDNMLQTDCPLGSSSLLYFFFCFSQNIKCIKDQLNSATNKDSTTADRVDGWSTAREKFDPLCIMLLCVSKGQRTQSTKRGNKHHVTQSGNRQTCLMKLLFTQGFDLTLI